MYRRDLSSHSGQLETSTMTSFHYFPLLPPELRVHIWKLSVQPRVVDIYINSKEEDPPIHSSTQPPAILQACHEARNQGLYEKAFIRPAYTRYTWVNFTIDIISIGQMPFGYIKPEAALIQRLKFERENDDLFFYSCSRKLLWFSKVIDVYVVIVNGFTDWYEAWSDFPWQCKRENLWFIDKDTGEVRDSYALDKAVAELWQEAEE